MLLDTIEIHFDLMMLLGSIYPTLASTHSLDLPNPSVYVAKILWSICVLPIIETRMKYFLYRRYNHYWILAWSRILPFATLCQILFTSPRRSNSTPSIHLIFGRTIPFRYSIEWHPESSVLINACYLPTLLQPSNCHHCLYIRSLYRYRHLSPSRIVPNMVQGTLRSNVSNKCPPLFFTVQHLRLDE